jgi:hypothetical protein
MTIADNAVLVAGASRGIGRALIAVHCQCRIRNGSLGTTRNHK